MSGLANWHVWSVRACHTPASDCMDNMIDIDPHSAVPLTCPGRRGRQSDERAPPSRDRPQRQRSPVAVRRGTVGGGGRGRSRSPLQRCEDAMLRVGQALGLTCLWCAVLVVSRMLQSQCGRARGR